MVVSMELTAHILDGDRNITRYSLYVPFGVTVTRPIRALKGILKETKGVDMSLGDKVQFPQRNKAASGNIDTIFFSDIMLANGVGCKNDLGITIMNEC